MTDLTPPDINRLEAMHAVFPTLWYRAFNGNFTVSGGAVTQSGTPDMKSNLASGWKGFIAGVYTEASTDDATHDAADGSNDRFDIVYITTGGDYAIHKGTAAASSAIDPDDLTNWHKFRVPFPADSIPAGVILAIVRIRAGATTVETADIWEVGPLIKGLMGQISWAQGAVPFYGASGFSKLAPGTAHYPLVSGGAAADITFESISSILDNLIGSTRGGVAYRGESAWALLAPSTAGHVLTDGGAGADPSWEANTIITADSFSEAISFLTTDLAAGKSGSVSFMASGHITRVRLRANIQAGQLAPGSLLINNAGNTYSRTATSLAVDGQSGTLATNDYLKNVTTGEIVKVTSDPSSSPITVARGQMGTVAAPMDDDDQLVRLNDGATLVIWYDSNQRVKEEILRQDNIMTSVGTTDAATSGSANKIELDGAMPNLYNGATVILLDTADEEAVVSSPPRDVNDASEDNVIEVCDVVGEHDSGKNVEKICEMSMVVPYDPAGGTLYYTIYWNQANLGATITFTLDVYGEGY